MTIPIPTPPVRSVIRKKVAQLLQGSLVGPGLPVEAVYDYQIADFDKQSPVIVVTSSGTEDLNEVQQVVYIDVHVFVTYSASTAAGEVVWTEEQSEDAIDLISAWVASIIGYYKDRRREDEPEWEQVEADGRTNVEPVLISGINNRHEILAYGFLVGNKA